jgi:hypothetical protein
MPAVAYFPTYSYTHCPCARGLRLCGPSGTLPGDGHAVTCKVVWPGRGEDGNLKAGLDLFRPTLSPTVSGPVPWTFWASHGAALTTGTAESVRIGRALQFTLDDGR